MLNWQHVSSFFFFARSRCAFNFVSVTVPQFIVSHVVVIFVPSQKNAQYWLQRCINKYIIIKSPLLFLTLLIYVCTVWMQMFVCVCVSAGVLSDANNSPLSPLLLLHPDVFLGMDRCLWSAVGTLASSPCLYTSVPVCGGSRRAAWRSCETDRHQQRHLAHEGSLSINKFQCHASFKLLWLGDLCVLTWTVRDDGGFLVLSRVIAWRKRRTWNSKHHYISGMTLVYTPYSLEFNIHTILLCDTVAASPTLCCIGSLPK